MALNFSFGPANFGAPGGAAGGGFPTGLAGGGFGASPMGFGAGFQPMGGMGSMDPMMAMNSQMMNMFAMSMMAMMTQLMQMLTGGNALSGAPGQFGGGSGSASPLGGFLGGGDGGSASSGGASGGGGTAVAPAGSGAGIGPADGSTSPKTKSFIDQALSKQGTPYVFGAAGPDKFDCSGLVCWALKQAGVSGGRTTARGLQDRYKSTAIKNKNDLKPGDLVFFWSPNDRGIPKGQATHVEIYLGNGKTMGTDSPKEGAKVEPINWDTFIGGARVPELNK
jgi:cell wall-associated NlpC family hydrolase